MSANFSTALLKIGVALAKHHAKNLIGDEALEVFASTLTDVGGEKLQEKVDIFLASGDGEKELIKAAKSADENFRVKCKDKDFRELFTMSHGDLTSVQSAIANLPKDFSEESLKNTLFDVFRAELPKRVSGDQVNDGVNFYLTCLYDALLPVKEFGLRILHNEIKEMGKGIKGVEQLLVKVSADVTRALVSLPGSYITPDLIAPYEKTSNEVVVGKTISIDHIRDQRFMLRKDVLADVLNEMDLFLSKYLNNYDSEILTFWISGRSGSGKSVLLLQIMQEIVTTRNAKVIWLDDAADKLSVLLEKWVEQADVRETLFVFVDDFNSPQVRDRIDYKAIARLLRIPKYHKIKWPVLVTCSPPEYLEEFQKTGGTEYFQVKKWAIPSVSKSEREYFLEWFSLRTGEIAKPGLAFEQDNGLVLSMMLELRHGSIVEFARRFKERLAGSNILEQMTLLLALNRLYIWAPAIWLSELTPEQQDGLLALNLDQDFSVLNIENSEKKYIRLTHPHLSDAIYKAIRPDSFGNQRADDLVRAFEKVIITDDVLASRILLVIAQGGDRITLDLNEKVLAEKIITHCKTLLEFVNRTHPVNLAFIWVNLAKWASREPHVDFILSTPALNTALKVLGKDYYLWGDLWLQLWGCYPRNEKLGSVGWEWANHRHHFDEAAWYPIWNTLLNNSDSFADIFSRSDILKTGILWLRGREERKWWSMVWENLLESSSDLLEEEVSDVINSGLIWLNGREDSAQWSYVWQGILKHSRRYKNDVVVDGTLKYGIEWLGGRQDQMQWAFVWQDVIKYKKYFSPEADITKLLEYGVDWVLERSSSNQWTFVWQTLIANFDKLHSSSARKKLIKWGLSWVDKNREKKEWPIIYNDLAKIKYSREFKSITSPKKFILNGIEWIEIHKDEARAAQLALFLMKSYQTNFSRSDLPLPDVNTYNRLLELITLMVRKSDIKNEGWHYWWLAYWEAAPTIKNAKIALKWMEVYSGNLEGARSIINKLLFTKKTDVIDALLIWEKEHSQNPISEIIRTKFEKQKEKEITQQEDFSDGQSLDSFPSPS